MVLYLATSTTLLSYLLIFPAGIILRYKQPRRAAAVPLGTSGNGVMIVCTVAVHRLDGARLVGRGVPGTIESLFGIDYSIQDAYGVSRVRFEVFTLGTLAIILAVGVIGYILARPVREREVDLPLVAAAPAAD